MLPDKRFCIFRKLALYAGLCLSSVGSQVFAENTDKIGYALYIESEQSAVIHSTHSDCHATDFMYPFPVIAKSLGSEFELNSEEQVLTVIRAQDKAVFTLSFKDGLVTANGQKVGYVPNIDQVDIKSLSLNQSAIEVLTGTHVHCNAANRSIELNLDKRLKPQFGFTLFVDGRPLAAVERLPRSIGTVLLLPLEPIARELNQTLTRVDGNTIEIFRIQDSVTFSLNLQSGLVKMNGTPIGITPNMAFAVQDQLLLPSTAIETLTGTNVKIIPGKNNIEINLDERLTNRVLPGDNIYGKASSTGFVPETLDFYIGNQNLNTLTFRSHVHQFNTRFRYEVPDFPQNLEQTQPSWVALEFDSLSGYGGSLGDYNSTHRELREIDVSRLRGVSMNKRMNDGWLLGVAGLPLVGSKQLDDTNDVSNANNSVNQVFFSRNRGITSSFDALQLSRPEFQGFAAGVRYLHESRLWEVGLSGRNSINGDSARIVGNLFRTWRHSKGFLENAFTSVNLDLGGFTNGNDGPIDARIRLNHSLNPVDFLRINLNSDYFGVNFQNFDLSSQRGIQLQNIPTNASDQTRTSLSFNFNLPHNAGFSVFGNWSQTGIRSDYVGNNVTYGANLALRPFRLSPWTSITYSRSLGKTTEQDYSLTDETVFIWANQDIDWFRYSARFEYDLLNNNQLASLNLSHKPIEYHFADQAVISANAIATGIWTDQSGFKVNLGGRIHADSGHLLGKQWKIGADFTRFQPLPSLVSNQDGSDIGSANSLNDTQASNFLSVFSSYKINRDYELGLNYLSDFEDQQTIRLSLRGHIGFNPPRRYNNALKGRGVIKGRVFIDSNGDGLFQADEKPLGGVILQVEGTRLMLRTDPDGYYTIANLPTGSYRLTVDERRLPLGLIRESAYIRYATIGDGQITEYDIAMIQSGQIRGRLFIDSNHNGVLDKGEKGLEGVRLLLNPGGLHTITSAFGQFAFDELETGEYQIQLDEDNHQHWTISTPDDVLTTKLLTDQRLHKINIPVN
ncbi:MAG: MSCRAMM family adhesin SdrC [Gammaproteobacteria bacterium]|nr:MSCRAMM family adhesin SdrC [Gammaproteobacteria bacterium]